MLCMYIKQINIEILKKKINVLYTNVYDIYIYIYIYRYVGSDYSINECTSIKVVRIKMRRCIITKGLRSAQQVSSSSQCVHLL
jgi:hypothetical protein